MRRRAQRTPLRWIFASFGELKIWSGGVLRRAGAVAAPPPCGSWCVCFVCDAGCDVVRAAGGVCCACTPRARNLRIARCQPQAALRAAAATPGHSRLHPAELRTGAAPRACFSLLLPPSLPSPHHSLWKFPVHAGSECHPERADRGGAVASPWRARPRPAQQSAQSSGRPPTGFRGGQQNRGYTDPNTPRAFQHVSCPVAGCRLRARGWGVGWHSSTGVVVRAPLFLPPPPRRGAIELHVSSPTVRGGGRTKRGEGMNVEGTAHSCPPQHPSESMKSRRTNPSEKKLCRLRLEFDHPIIIPAIGAACQCSACVTYEDTKRALQGSQSVNNGHTRCLRRNRHTSGLKQVRLGSARRVVIRYYWVRRYEKAVFGAANGRGPRGQNHNSTTSPLPTSHTFAARQTD